MQPSAAYLDLRITYRYYSAVSCSKAEPSPCIIILDGWAVALSDKLAELQLVKTDSIKIMQRPTDTIFFFTKIPPKICRRRNGSLIKKQQST